ncbi:MAG: AraC family transcriptional regulator [Actinobacteria bacterium]|nr:AraC family transcriptional regulator [Actinomycetota bacterium]
MRRTPAWLGEVSDRVRLRASGVDPAVVLGEFHCAPGDPIWGQRNDIGPVPHIVFPGTGVGIAPEGGSPFTADATQIVLYDAGRPYRRRLVDPRGDHCTFLAIHPTSLGALAAEHALAGVTGSVARPRFVTGRTVATTPTVLLLRALLAELRSGEPDQLLVDEALVRLVGAALGGGEAGEGTALRSEATRRRHERLVEDTKALIASDPARSWALADLGRTVGASSFHLHRVFRATTGMTIHTYQQRLRLREALAVLGAGTEDLASLAHGLGFSSHSHFTDRFRREFGVTPSAARRLRRSELRKMVTAMEGTAT